MLCYALLASFLLSGCIAMHEPSPYRGQGQTDLDQTSSIDNTLQQNSPMLVKARYAKKSGHYNQALSLLERGIRTDPYNGWIWYELASINLALGNVQQSAELCKKSISLANNDQNLIHQNRLLLEQLGR